jgi:hypothetical protein
MLIEVVEVEMFIDLLLTVERRAEPGCGSQMIRFSECTFTFLKIFQPNTLDVQWMPSNLAGPIVCMPMEGGDDASQAHCSDIYPKRAPHQCLEKSTHDVVAEPYVSTIVVK